MRRFSLLTSRNDCLELDGMARASDRTETARRTQMLDLGIDRIGELGIVECRGRIVRSEAALKLRRAVTSLEDLRIIVLDLSEVNAIEGGGLGMLQFLLRWTRDHGIQFTLFNPRKSVRDRLELVRSTPPFHIASLEEMMALLTNADSRFATAA
jgi:anti-anti-sigma regulatory factor